MLGLEVRRFLDGRGFVEVDTPVLASAWTPDRTDAFLAIRERAQVFALPGRRAVHGRVIAASGFDLVVFARASTRGAARALAAEARLAAGRSLRVDKGHGLARIRGLRYFRFDEVAKRWVREGDPLTRPVEQDLDDDPHRMRMQAHRLVLDGVEVGGGAAKAHDLRQVRRLFDALGIDPAEVDACYARLLSVLRFGVPPWARLTIGFDRLAALLFGLGSIDEVIALPKMPDGSDPLARSPWPIDNGTVRGLLGL